MKSPKPVTIGRIVIYVPQKGENFGGNESSPLPAIIVRTWETSGYQNDELNLKVFTDAGHNAWRTSVPYSETREENTWHWPEVK